MNSVADHKQFWTSFKLISLESCKDVMDEHINCFQGCFAVKWLNYSIALEQRHDDSLFLFMKWFLKNLF